MLPGFRFLFAAILLSMSVLVFGLGAAALLRAAHEEFANIPARRAPPEPMFAQAERPAPDTGHGAPGTSWRRRMRWTAANATAAVEPVAEATTPAEPEMLAAVEPEDSAAVMMPEPAPARQRRRKRRPRKRRQLHRGASAAGNDGHRRGGKIRDVAETPAPATEAAPAEPEQTAAIATPETSVAATRIATLGGPAVTISKSASAKAADAKPDQTRGQGSGSQGAAREAPRLQPRATGAAGGPAAQPIRSVAANVYGHR